MTSLGCFVKYVSGTSVLSFPAGTQSEPSLFISIHVLPSDLTKYIRYSGPRPSVTKQ